MITASAAPSGPSATRTGAGSGGPPTPVYALPSADQGALGSRYRLHTERALNHHFAVYRGFLADEARAALGEPDGGAS